MKNLTIKVTSSFDLERLIYFFFGTNDEEILDQVKESKQSYIYKANKTIWVTKEYRYSNYSRIMNVNKIDEYYIICYDELK